MKTFNNDLNRSSAEKSLTKILKIGFWVSAVTTAFCVAAWLYELATPYANGIFAYLGIGASVATTALWALIFLAIIRPLHTVEVTIGYSAKMVFTEFAGYMASRSGMISGYTAVRGIAMAGWLFVLVTLAAFSGLTSYYGAKMAAANVTIAVNTEKVTSIPKERQTAVSSATKVQQDKLARLQEEREKAIATAEAQIAGETKRLAKRGNEWAKNEIASATKNAARPYDSKIAKAEAELTAAQKEADKRYDKVETALLAANEIEISAAQQKSQSNSIFTMLFGIAPLALSIAGIAIISMSEVAAAIPSRGNGISTTNGGTQTNTGGAHNSLPFS